MYATILILDKNTSINTEDIDTINRKITYLEETISEVDEELNNLKIIYKGLRDAVNNTEIEVDTKVRQAVDDKFNEQSATGGLGVLTGDYVDLEEVE
jgi:glucan phosphorylase